jgi:hypothetical protein
MLLHSDTVRINIQRFDPDQEIDSNDPILMNDSLNRDADDMNEIKFSVLFDNEDYDDEDTCDYKTEQEETNEEKRVRSYCSLYKYILYNKKKSVLLIDSCDQFYSPR